MDALSIFYTLLAVSLFVPVVAGLYSRRARAEDALAAIVAGISVVIAGQLWNGGKPTGFLTPAVYGLAAAAAAFAIVSLAFSQRRLV